MEYTVNLDKKKQILGIFISVIFIVVGTILMTYPELFGYIPFKLSWLFAVGMTITLLFTFVIFFLINKMRKTKHGLIINEEGILDQATALKLGLIKWEDIKYLSVKRELAAKFIVVHLKNPEEFLAKFSGIKKSTIKKNAQSFGSPAALSTAMLAMKFDDVKDLVEKVANNKGIQFQ